MEVAAGVRGTALRGGLGRRGWREGRGGGHEAGGLRRGRCRGGKEERGRARSLPAPPGAGVQAPGAPTFRSPAEPGAVSRATPSAGHGARRAPPAAGRARGRRRLPGQSAGGWTDSPRHPAGGEGLPPTGKSASAGSVRMRARARQCGDPSPSSEEPAGGCPPACPRPRAPLCEAPSPPQPL